MPTQPSLRLGLLALMAWFMLVVSQHPVSVGAVDLPALGHEFEVAVSHMETELPTGPNVHAVEYWNGVVCETPGLGSDPDTIERHPRAGAVQLPGGDGRVRAIGG